jgi:hypothetical protein
MLASVAVALTVRRPAALATLGVDPETGVPDIAISYVGAP